MAYGIQTLRTDQSIIMDGSTVGGVFLEVLTLSVGQTSSKTYGRSVGGTLYAYTLVAGSHTISCDTDPANGQGRLNWTAAASSTGQEVATVVAVFAKKLTSATAFGMEFLNDSGEVLLDTQYPVPQYLGQVPLRASTFAPAYIPAGYVAYRFESTASEISALGSSTNRMAMMTLPDSGAADIWYNMENPYLAAGNTTSAPAVSVYAPAGVSFEVPQYFIYSIDKPPSAGTGFGLTVNDGVNTTYNSSSENLSVKAYATINAPAAGAAAVTASVTFPTKAAVALPLYMWTTGGSEGTDYYYLAFRRSGNTQLQYKMMYTTHGQNGIYQGYSKGTPSNGYFAVVDVSALGSAPTTYTPSGTPLAAPTITANPSNTATLHEGDTATFTCTATGNPAPTYQWLKNGGAFTGGSSSGSVSFTVGAGDYTGDVYSCYVSNSQGHVTSAGATITVDHSGTGAPVISVQPQNVSTPVGTAVTMTCQASPVTSIRWYLNGADTGVLGTSYSPPVSTAGSYSVQTICSNGTAQTYSATATLTVTSGGGPYPSYNNQADISDVRYDTTVPMTVTGSDAWHNGTGDYTLYDVMVSITTSSPATPFTAGSPTVGAWNSLGAASQYTWTLKRPVSIKSGFNSSVQGVIHIRLRSTGQEVAVQNYYLESDNS